MTTQETKARVPTLLVQYLDLLVCPACRGSLDWGDESVGCRSCDLDYPCDGGIPLLFWPNEWDGAKADVTKQVKSFYEEHPFPNYDEIDSCWTLQEKARKGLFARLLDEQIPQTGTKILEVGCGTGQLSNFLGMTSGRAVFGTDLCVNSLKLGQRFKERNEIERVAFLQMNLFRPAFQPASFDYVICNGVLHHTSDPRLGFRSIATLVKPGGFILVGLYNRYGRVWTGVRRAIFRLSGDRFYFLDPRLRTGGLNELRRRTWFMDQYKNPHESTHTMGEVLRWFDDAGVEFVNSIPPGTAFESFSDQEPLFTPKPRGTGLDRFVVQLGMLVSGGREGGFFIMIGRKRS